MHDVDKPATAEVRAALDVKPDEPLGYRRVRLKCGDRVLSEADNWYVPARLTPEMNHVLETTDTPFGKAVAALHFRRHTLSADLLFRPLPQGWETGGVAAQDKGSALAIPDHVLEHRAVLSTARWRAVQRSCGDLYRRSAGLPGAEMRSELLARWPWRFGTTRAVIARSDLWTMLHLPPISA